MKERSEDVKIWTEPTMERIIDTIHRRMDIETKGTNVFLFGLIMDIEGSATDTQEATLYGYTIADLATVAEALQRNDVMPEEIEDWSKALEDMYTSMMDEAVEAAWKACKEAVEEATKEVPPEPLKDVLKVTAQ